MPDQPLAYFITWTTYGSWLPGDERGWIDGDRPGIQQPNADLRDDAERRLANEPVVLTPEQRRIVDETLVDHAQHRCWVLHARNARTNHVHLVVTSNTDPENTRDQFKSWCSRRLNAAIGQKRDWWTKRGSTKWIWNETALEDVIWYVNKGQ